MMNYSFTNQFDKKLKLLKLRNPRLVRKIQRQIKLLLANPHHPSLRNHKLKGKMKKNWSISINNSFRVLYVIEDNKYIFFNLGFHSEIYED